MHIDAIVTDLDDTLLNEEGKLSPYTVEIFRLAKQQGVKIIPASGRAAYSMLPYVKTLDTGLPYIACNGAQLINADHSVLATDVFSPDRAREIVRFLKQHGFYVQCYLDEFFYFDTECDASNSYRSSSGMLFLKAPASVARTKSASCTVVSRYWPCNAAASTTA